MNIDFDENENLINQEPDFITFGDHPEEISEEVSEEISQEEPEEISETQAETQVVDYSQDFLILENLGYIQISMIGALLFYFVLTLVIKFIKSFF